MARFVVGLCPFKSAGDLPLYTTRATLGFRPPRNAFALLISLLILNVAFATAGVARTLADKD